MNKLIRYFLALMLPIAAQAQNANQSPSFTKTTLSAAITSSAASCFNVASVTGFVVGYGAVIDNESIYPIRSINTTSLQVCGTRGYQSRATTHGSGRAVIVAQGPNFQSCLGNGCGFLNNQTPYMQFSAGAFYPTLFPDTVTTAGAVTYTAGQVLNGFILRDPNGAGRTDVLPTAELLLSSLPGATLGTIIPVVVRNDADASETITMTAGTGGTVTGGGTMTVAQNNMKLFWIRFTGVVPGSAAYIVYSMGSVVF